MYPGLLLQKLTTREPSPDQVEVALLSLKEVLRVQEGGARTEAARRPCGWRYARWKRGPRFA